MILKDLTLGQFRSYTKRTFTFSPTTTHIIGPNTAGKTNILEAIMVLSTGKSFRATRDEEMIRWGQKISSITCHMSGDEETMLDVYITPTKKYKVNGIARRQIDFVGTLRAVLFWPEHMELVTDSPSLRRKYLDGVLVQVDREYRRNLLSYERGLRQRNRLLDLIGEGKAHRSQLLFWNQLLIKAGSFITDKRASFIEYLNTKNCNVIYDKSVISESRLEQYSDEEVAAKATLVGPHRDDFIFTKNNLDLSKFGSRGEQRLTVLSLKFAELSYIEKETGSRPILLLDDIFSEFDQEHRKHVISLLGKQQTIVTSAEDSIKFPADIIRL